MNVNRTRTLKRLHLFPFVFKLSSRGSLRLNGTSVVLEGSAFISKVWRLKAQCFGARKTWGDLVLTVQNGHI